MSLSGKTTAAAPGWPRYCEVHDPPYACSRASSERTYWLSCAAVVPVVAAGAQIFGYGALSLHVAATLGAVFGDRVCRMFVSHGARSTYAHAVSVGLLLALTLPPTAGLTVPFLGGFLGIVIGKGLLGGLGNYLWHPALVGRAAVELIFPQALMPLRWPFLAADHGLTSSLEAASPGPGYRGFDLTHPPPGVEAWSMPRPIDRLVEQYLSSGDAAEAGPSLLSIFRDHLPPWPDTLWGVVGGGIGETCAVAILAGGLFLICARCARWQLPIGALGAVAVLAAVWPIRIDTGSDAPVWFPILAVRDGFPVGVALVLFHLTGGGLLTSCLLIAPDPVSTPLPAKGHFMFGIGLGTLAFVGQVSGLSPGSAYWAVLAMNTVVPVIDRLTRRRVYGTSKRELKTEN